MSVWQLLKNGLPTGDNYDDELPGQPGDPDFSPDAVKTYVASKPTKYNGYNWMNTSE